jgi:hypothetical protein
MQEKIEILAALIADAYLVLYSEFYLNKSEGQAH